MLNTDAVVELLGELVYTHTFRTHDARERAHELLKELRADEGEKQNDASDVEPSA